MNLDFLSWELLNNKLGDYLLALIIFLSRIIIIRVVKLWTFKSLKKWAAKTKNIYDDAIVIILEINFIPITYIGSIYLAISNLTLHPILSRVVEVLVILASTILAIELLTAIAEYAVKLYWITYHHDNANIERKSENEIALKVKRV